MRIPWTWKAVWYSVNTDRPAIYIRQYNHNTNRNCDQPKYIWVKKEKLFIKSFITAVNVLDCWHRFRFRLLSLCSSCCSVIPLPTSLSKLCLFYLSLHSMLLFANSFLFSPWGLLSLVSNLVSHRDRNKPGAIWGIFTAYLNYKTEHVFFFNLYHHTAAVLMYSLHPPTPRHIHTHTNMLTILLSQGNMISSFR